MKIVARAHAKINWALNITGLRSDGYHLLDMLMQSIELGDDMAFEDADALTLTVNSQPDRRPVMFSAQLIFAWARTVIFI